MRILLLLLSLILLLSGSATAEESPLPRLRTEGNRLETPDGSPVTLRGASLCSLDWHEPLTLFKNLTDKKTGWNVNVVRLPVQPAEWEQLGPKNYLENRLDPAVAECRKSGVYCVIDWHEIADWDNEETARKLEAFWLIVAPRYAQEPFILYEIFNEPKEPSSRDRGNWLAFRARAQGWIDMVRKDAPETVLLVGSPHWSQMPAFAVEDPFRGDNLVYVAHIYGGWPVETWDELFGNAAWTVPLFISEWGWSSLTRNRGAPFYGTLNGYGEPLRAYLDARPQISWTAWSYDPECGPAMLGKDKEMGAFVYRWLEESSPGPHASLEMKTPLPDEGRGVP